MASKLPAVLNPTEEDIQLLLVSLIMLYLLEKFRAALTSMCLLPPKSRPNATSVPRTATSR